MNNMHSTPPSNSRSHHHHHHYKEDGASKFKRESLNSIQRRKMLKKISFITLVIIAILMFIALIWVYTAG